MIADRAKGKMAPAAPAPKRKMALAATASLAFAEFA
jgi:hypothetical protein